MEAAPLTSPRGRTRRRGRNSASLTPQGSRDASLTKRGMPKSPSRMRNRWAANGDLAPSKPSRVADEPANEENEAEATENGTPERAAKSPSRSRTPKKSAAPAKLADGRTIVAESAWKVETTKQGDAEHAGDVRVRVGPTPKQDFAVQGGRSGEPIAVRWMVQHPRSRLFYGVESILQHGC